MWMSSAVVRGLTGAGPADEVVAPAPEVSAGFDAPAGIPPGDDAGALSEAGLLASPLEEGLLGGASVAAAIATKPSTKQTIAPTRRIMRLRDPSNSATE